MGVEVKHAEPKLITSCSRMWKLIVTAVSSTRDAGISTVSLLLLPLLVYPGAVVLPFVLRGQIVVLSTTLASAASPPALSLRLAGLYNSEPVFFHNRSCSSGTPIRICAAPCKPVAHA